MAVMDLDSLWDFNQPAQSEARLRAEQAATAGDDTLVLRTQVARALGLQRRFDEALAELDAVDAAGGGAEVRCYAALERGRVLRCSGDHAEAQPRFLAALDLATEAGLDHLGADAAHMLAIVLDGNAQIPWAERALRIAESSADPRARRWIAPVTNNLAWTMHDLGRFDEALRLFERALAERVRRGEPEPVRIARWSVARALRSLGRLDEALAIQLELADGPDDGYVHEELGELLLALDRPADAAPHFATAHQLLSGDAWLADTEPQRLARLAALAAG